MKPLILSLALASSLTLAQNVPQQVALTARLSNAGVPLTGSHTLLLRLFDSATGGAEVWNESALATADNGVVALTLGAQAPLTPSILDGRPLFVEVSVDGQVLLPRLPVVSVPYAVRASVAASASTLGTLAPGDVALTGHTHNYLPVGTMLSCSGTDKMVGLTTSGSVLCAADTGATYTAGAGITLANGQIATTFAGTGQSATSARSDHNHAGIYLPFGSTLTCPGTQKVIGLNTNGSVVCGNDADTDTNTTYSAGAGLQLTGTSFSVSLGGTGTATTVARSDHFHSYSCPTGYLSHWFSGGAQEGTKVLCSRAVAQTATWPQAARSCATANGSGRLCSILELTIARAPTTFSHPQQVLLSGYWLADRLADDLAAVTNATSGDNFDFQQDPLTSATGYYCCTDGNFFR
jgi:hypothetical protein